MVNGKEKFALWLTPETKEQVKQLYREDDCKSQSEYIEKAIQFYSGYVQTKNAGDYLPEVLFKMIDEIMTGFGNRIGSLLFRHAVDLNVMNHILAADTDMDIPTYERLRGLSVREVKAVNGKVSFKDALKFQKTI